jgi:hypothetical protein
MEGITMTTGGSHRRSRQRFAYVAKARPLVSEADAVEGYGVDAQTYSEGTALFEAADERWWASGRAREEWSIPPHAVTGHTNAYVMSAGNVMRDELATRIDVPVEEINGAMDRALGAMAAIDEVLDAKLDVIEDGGSLSLAEAVEDYEEMRDAIDDANDRGETVHLRAGRWYQWLGILFLILDAVGMWAVLAGFLNADIARPLDNPLQLTLALFGTAAIVSAQIIFANQAGSSHNRARFMAWLSDSVNRVRNLRELDEQFEGRAKLRAQRIKEESRWVEEESQRLDDKARRMMGESEQAKKEELEDLRTEQDLRDTRLRETARKGRARIETPEDQVRIRNWQLIALGVTTLVACGAIGIRAMEVLEQLNLTNAFIEWVLYVVFVVSPVIMAGLLYLAKAIDGSLWSRRMEVLGHDLDASWEEYNDVKTDATDAVGTVQQTYRRLWDTEFNDLLDAVQEELDRAIAGFRFGEVQIGCEPVAIAESKHQRVARDQRKLARYMSCGIPGAATLDIGPVIAKVHSVANLHKSIADVEDKLEKIRPHPWTPSTSESKDEDQ